MEVASSCPMHATGFVWQLSAGTFAQTIIAKATFLLEPGHAKLAPKSRWEPIHEQEQFVKDDIHGALFAPTDLVPFKRRVDVLLVGHAYAPEKQPVRSLVTRLAVGDSSKSIEVFCDRAFRSPEDPLIEGPRFSKMPLDWAHAAAGSSMSNPSGMRFDATPNAFGLIAIPNLQPIKTTVCRGSDTFEPVGYGPISPLWPGRTQRVERFGNKFSPLGWEGRPLPENFDFDYFQAAPRDQQLEQLRPDALLVLENLHPVHAQLSARLPDVCPRAVVHRASGEREDVTLVADTLWIDTDRGICCVVWRGSIGLRHATEAGLIGVALAEKVVELLDDNVIETMPQGLVDDDDLASMTLIAPFGTKPKGPAMPFVAANLPDRPELPSKSNDDGALPFGSAGLSTVPPAPIAMGQITLPAQSPPNSPTANGGQAFVLPVPFAKPLEAVSPSQPSSALKSQVGSTTAPSMVAPESPSTPTTMRRTNGSSAPGLSGASSAVEHDDSTAKMDGFVEPDIATEPTRDVLQLLWYDARTIAEMRRSPTWKSLVDALDGGPHGREDMDNQREIFEVLAKGERTDSRTIDDALDGAIGSSGRFVPPMVIVAGDLELHFDELEALKAAVSAAVPLITEADEQLRGAVAVAKDFVQTMGLSSAPAVSEGLARRIREAFFKEKTSVPSDYLLTQVEQVMLFGRHYQTREVFGATHLRCNLWLRGETSALVAYVPAEVSKTLPIWKRFGVRIIAEVHPAQDQYETSGKALKIVGLGRDIKRNLLRD